MKLGILGTGKMVGMALPALAELGAERQYLLARPHSREKAEALAGQYRLDGIFYDYEQLLAADIDTVYVALPNLLHYEYAKKALLAGKHAIVEKPMVVHAWELAELRELARERELVLVEAMTVHQLPAYQAMAEQLERIGTPRLAVFNYSQRSSRYDDFLAGVVRPAFDPAQAGGALMDINVYNLQALLGLFGPPKGVCYHATVQRGIDTSGVLTLDYGAFQAVAVGAKDCGGPSGAVIQGEKGRLQVTGPVSAMTAFTAVDNDGSTREFSLGDHRPTDRLLREFRVFQRMIDTGDRTGLDRLLEISAASTAVMETARRQAGVVFPGDRAEGEAWT